MCWWAGCVTFGQSSFESYTKPAAGCSLIFKWTYRRGVSIFHDRTLLESKWANYSFKRSLNAAARQHILDKSLSSVRKKLIFSSNTFRSNWRKQVAHCCGAVEWTTLSREEFLWLILIDITGTDKIIEAPVNITRHSSSRMIIKLNQCL